MIEYHPGLPDIKEVLRKHQPLLHLSPVMKEVVPNLPLLAFSQPPNLRRLLVRAKIKRGTSTVGPSKHCNKNCKLCTDLVNCSVIRSHSCGKVFKVKARESNCMATWVVIVFFALFVVCSTSE